MAESDHPRTRFSVRSHFHLYMGAMLVLLVVLGATAYLSLQTTINLFETVTDREFIEMRRLVLLQDFARTAAEPVHHFVAWQDPDQAELFEEMAVEVDTAFVDVLVMPTLKPEQRSLVLKAQREWQRAQATARRLFSQSAPLTRSELIGAENDFENHVQIVVDTLYEAHNIRIKAIEEHKQQATTGYRTMRAITLASFLGGLLIFIAASSTIARYVLKPLGILRTSIERFGRGELSYRVPLSSDNELGELARGFNNMAERLEQHQSTLEQLAIRDSLTDLYNRREFERLLSEELHRSQRYHHPVSLLIIDIDRFKSINDTYGHRAGDDALRMVSSVIRDVSRKGDVVARYGGEELALILPETSARDALAFAERIRNSVANQPVMFTHGRVVQLTVSVGVATAPDDASTQGKLVDIADRAMYAAKAAGRNCVAGGAGAGADNQRPDTPAALP